MTRNGPSPHHPVINPSQGNHDRPRIYGYVLCFALSAGSALAVIEAGLYALRGRTADLHLIGLFLPVAIIYAGLGFLDWRVARATASPADLLANQAVIRVILTLFAAGVLVMLSVAFDMPVQLAHLLFG